MPKKITGSTTLENYTNIRANISPKVRQLLPSRSELFDRKTGELKVSEAKLQFFFESVDRYRSMSPKAKAKATRANFTGVEEVFEKALKNRKILTADESAMISGSRLRAFTLSEQARKDLSLQASRLHDRDFYKAKYYVEKGAYDVDQATDEMNFAVVDFFSDMDDGKLSQKRFNDVIDWYEEVTGEEVAYSNADTKLTKAKKRKLQREALRKYSGADAVVSASEIYVRYNGGDDLLND